MQNIYKNFGKMSLKIIDFHVLFRCEKKYDFKVKKNT